MKNYTNDRSIKQKNIARITQHLKTFSWWLRNGVSIPRGRRFHSRKSTSYEKYSLEFISTFWCNISLSLEELVSVCHGQGSKFHSSDRLSLVRRVKMAVGQVEYLQDLPNGRLPISDFHISCIGFIYFRRVNGTFRQVIFTIHLPDWQVHSIWNFEAWWCLDKNYNFPGGGVVFVTVHFF